MGGRDSYFFHHTWPETKGRDLSRLNQDEAEMLVGFFQYLVLNGVKHSQITVLTVSGFPWKLILGYTNSSPVL
jgi:helicase required for RNAi-mediated heterochromatin assembly 1